MNGGNWVALASVVITAAVSVASMKLQRVGETERAAAQFKAETARATAQREEKRDERWLDDRRAFYARFLRGADTIEGAFRDLYWTYAVQVSESASTDIRSGLTVCADALAEMRLFSPARVVVAATAYFESVRAHLAELARAGSTLHDKAGGGFVTRIDAATELLAAIREDLGSAPVDIRGLGNVTPDVLD